MSNSFKILELMNTLDNLKHLKRKGWTFYHVFYLNKFKL